MIRASGRLWSFLFLRCPNCRSGRLFKSWFQMHERCSLCGLAFYPESGYYVGSIYVNYAATVAVVLVSLFVFRAVPVRFELVFFSSVAALTSLTFFRHSRSLWITIDFSINPWKPDRAG
jgi:uncharacterized protein (DUF983 family)